MHASLHEGLDRAQRELQSDDRCLAVFLWGSAGSKTADEFSDLDVAVVVRDDCYASLKEDVPALCERTFGRPIAWIPEGEQDAFVNYAFLFKAGADLLLCDLMVVSETWIGANPTWISEEILLDRTGLSKKLSAGPKHGGAGFSASKLSECLHNYWIYIYLNGKQFRRSSVFKLLNIQQALFERHLSVLRFLYPDLAWTWWAAKDAYLLPEAHQERLLTYFTGARLDTICDLLRNEMDLFCEDARHVCRKCDTDYPDELERNVRQHLRRMHLK